MGETMQSKTIIPELKNAKSMCDSQWYRRSLAGDHTPHPVGRQSGAHLVIGFAVNAVLRGKGMMEQNGGQVRNQQNV